MREVLTEMAIVDAILTVWAYMLYRYQKKRMNFSLPTALLAGIFAVVVHLAAAAPLMHAVPAKKSFEFLLPFVLLGLVPMTLVGRMFIEAVSGTVASDLFSMNTVRPLRTEYSRARSLLEANKLDEAIEEFRKGFRENPDDPKPLFEVVEIHAKLAHYNDAADVLREIIAHFNGVQATWERAALRLAEIIQYHLNDVSSARKLLREMARRAPNSEAGRLAHARLADLRALEQERNNS